jgi:hypothetical protein
MRGLMAKPKKINAGGGEIENRFFLTLKVFDLRVLHFYARCSGSLADTLKTQIYLTQIT